MTLTVHTKLLGISGLAIAATLAAGIVGGRGLTELSRTSETVLLYTHATRHQLEADMMHDAIRADVLTAFFVKEKDEKELAKAREDLAGHAKILRDAMTANKQTELPAEVKEAIVAAAAPLEEYVAEAEEILKVASAGRAAAEKRMPAFLTAFEALAVKMEQVSNAITDGAKAAEQSGLEAARRVMATLFVAVVFASVLVGLLSFFVTRGVTRTIDGAVAAIQRLSKGDLTTRFAYDRDDEFGRLAASLNGAIADMRRAIEEMSDGARTLSGAARELTATAEQMSVSSEVTSERATSVSASVEEIQQSATVVASGTEELAIATQEVTRNVSVAAKVAADGVRLAETTNASLEDLARAGADIGAITKTISTIAQQTNMLALNATIEAARAGAAGKGFAVVASEVKELARQTESATDDISRKVAAIQTSTNRAIESIRDLANAMTRVDEVSQTLATAMEEQTATHAQISRTTADVAHATGGMSNDVTQVAAVAEQSAAAASQTRQAANELLRLAESLERTVSVFNVTEATPPQARSQETGLRAAA
jgi:methyl-accepting chemotaxis protein